MEDEGGQRHDDDGTTIVDQRRNANTHPYISLEQDQPAGAHGCTGEQEIEEVFSVGGYLRTAFGNYKEQQQKCAADQCSEKDNFIAG